MSSTKRLTTKKGKPSNKIDHEIRYLPREILVHIFEFYVKSEGVSRLLTTISRVSDAWKDAANDSRLWATVDDPDLSRKTLLKLQKKLSFTRNLNVSHLRYTLSPIDVLSVVSFCPKLKSINFRTNVQVSRELLHQLPKHCPSLQRVTFCEGHLTVNFLSPLLTACGPNLKYLDLSQNFSANFEGVLRKIAKACPLLEELRLQQISGSNMVFPYETFQTCCPKLRVMKLDEAQFPNSSKRGPGFPELEIFECRVVFESGPSENTLLNILHSSTKLKTLSLPGNTGCTYLPLLDVDCTLEALLLSRSKIANVSLHCIISKWKTSLKRLDLSMLKDESVLNETIIQFLNENSSSPLIELNLSSSPIYFDTFKALLSNCQKLDYLNIESCRNLPRGSKRIYHTYKEIQDLRKNLQII